MAHYIVEKPCSYINEDGSATEHREAGAFVELSDEVAADLGEAVRHVEVANVTGEAVDDDAEGTAAEVEVDGVKTDKLPEPESAPAAQQAKRQAFSAAPTTTSAAPDVALPGESGGDG